MAGLYATIRNFTGTISRKVDEAFDLPRTYARSRIRYLDQCKFQVC